MGALTPFFITGYAKGLVTNKKPFLLPDQAWSTLENGYVWRERELKREGNQLLGRLQRNLTAQSLGATVLNQTTYDFTDLFTTLSLRSTEPNAELAPGTLVITIAAPDTATFTDNGDGTFAVTGVGVAAGSYVNYSTGEVVLQLSAATGGADITADFSYYPSLPGMGIWQKDLVVINSTQTIWWDTKYAYKYNGTQFQEYITGGGAATWTGNDYDFFWAYNYESGPSARILFVTNDYYVDQTNFDPMYYTDGNTWTAFTPTITATRSLFQALILIPYYNRLVALNTWEGVTDLSGAASNFYNRARFSAAFKDPTQNANWRADVFGAGGSIDAPTGEAITGATFVKNTLVVDFEFSTWQLRYLGEYGTPFIWERVSSDFGSGSTFSGVLFDNYRLNIGDVGITRANSIQVDRIDLDIPDQVFAIQNQQTNQGSQRVCGVRDFQRELVFWTYPNAQSESVPGTAITYPDTVLLYNYRNQTWAVFRENATFFGYYQLDNSVNWDSLTVKWDDEDVKWDSAPNQPGFGSLVKVNQQGFVHLYGYKTPDDPSLSVTGIANVGGLVELTIPNHNLFSAEIIYLQGLMFIDSTIFLPVSTSLNDVIYQVQIVDANTVSLAIWNTTTQSYETDFSYTPDLSTVIYVGGGEVTIFPKMNLITKDINLFQKAGVQTKLSRIDFLLEPQPNNAQVTVNLLLNASPAFSANILITPTNLSYQTNSDFDPQASDYLWFSYFQTLSAQYFRIQLTYDDDLMNTLATHQSDFTLYAINAWTRPGGRFANPV
jgi:hypothetical protein